jgi:hypothetical protein
VANSQGWSRRSNGTRCGSNPTICGLVAHCHVCSNGSCVLNGATSTVVQAVLRDAGEHVRMTALCCGAGADCNGGTRGTSYECGTCCLDPGGGQCMGGCVIGGVHYDTNEPSGDGCYVCDPAQSTTSWTYRGDDADCGGGRCCGGSCRDVSWDNDNCGQCYNQCDPYSMCNIGNCIPI